MSLPVWTAIKTAGRHILKTTRSPRFILADITQSETTILSDTGIKTDDDNLVFIGCSPCQYWSIINTDRKISGKNTNLLTHFQIFVEYYNPGYVVIENVPGISNEIYRTSTN